jgi:poly-gamma-glutamate synthesis protein (capsule biosynthesis protein)
MHWGVKNVKSIKQSQSTVAQELADLGVDYIVGAHPHLLQSYVTLTASDGRTVPCFYSLGDFHSSIEQITGNRDSVILQIRLKRRSDGTVYLSSDSYIPCYTYTKYGGAHYVTVRVTSALSDYSAIHKRIVSAVGNQIAEYK